jgi:hypothetical protein
MLIFESEAQCERKSIELIRIDAVSLKIFLLVGQSYNGISVVVGGQILH